MLHLVDRCPMYFNDGENPWEREENHIRVFNFDNGQYYNSAPQNHRMSSLFLALCLFLIKKYVL